MPRLPLSGPRTVVASPYRFDVREIAGTLDCDGSTNDVEVADHADLRPGAGDWTFVFWYLLRSSTVNARLIDKRDTVGLMFYQSTASVLNLLIRDAAANVGQAACNAPVKNLWRHGAFLRSGNTLYVYTDAVQSGTGGCAAVGSIDVACGLSFGSTWVPNSRSSILLSDIGWWKGKALTPAQIADAMRRDQWTSGLTSRWRCNAIVGGKLLDDVSGHDAVVTAGTINTATVRQRLRAAASGRIAVTVGP